MLFLIFLIGLVTGFFDSVIGAGGLISVPALVFLGLPPQVAIATDRFGVIGQEVAALTQFGKAKKIVWKYVPIFTLLAFIGSLIGSHILLSVDPKILQTVIGVLLVILLPLVILQRKQPSTSHTTSRSFKIIGLVLYFLIMIFGAFFGQGTGPLIMYVLTYFLGLTLLEVLATGIIPWLVLSVSSAGIFALNGLIDYEKGILLLIGMTIGGLIGAKVAIKKGDDWLRYIFIAFVIVAAAKLLLF